ncbi:energy transducer TonB [Pelagibius sp.]|uniref:energy transducer TonB n=1 Tax=Pelagibius sp. TaxID=1931238 RepID=UPI002604E30D|nr:TonB family protein [Pelagibius sp.]
MRVAKRHWAFALSAALLLHLGLAAAILWQAPTSGARESGIGGIVVSLGQAGGAPGSPTPTEAALPEAETAASPEEAAAVPADLTAEVPPEAAPEPVTEAVEVDDVRPEETVTPAEPVADLKGVESVNVPAEVAAVPVEAAEASPPLETVEAAAVPIAVEAAAPLEAESVEPQRETRAAAVAVPPKPQRKPAPPQRVAGEPVPAKTVQAAQSPTPAVSQAARKTEVAALPKADTTAETATVAPAGAGGRSGTQASPDAGDATAASAGGQPAANTDYMAELLAWLERHKKYPRRARLRGQEGTAFIYFVMDRDGRVLDFSIKQTSGHRVLDREAKDMIERAQPLPRFPDHMAGARLALVVPVDFSLR